MWTKYQIRVASGSEFQVVFSSIESIEKKNNSLIIIIPVYIYKKLPLLC